eukprot:3364178-Alexandrium_andersonii.AAC.1
MRRAPLEPSRRAAGEVAARRPTPRSANPQSHGPVEAFQPVVERGLRLAFGIARAVQRQCLATSTALSRLPSLRPRGCSAGRSAAVLPGGGVVAPERTAVARPVASGTPSCGIQPLGDFADDVPGNGHAVAASVACSLEDCAGSAARRRRRRSQGRRSRRRRKPRKRRCFRRRRRRSIRMRTQARRRTPPQRASSATWRRPPCEGLPGGPRLRSRAARVETGWCRRVLHEHAAPIVFALGPPPRVCDPPPTDSIKG